MKIGSVTRNNHKHAFEVSTATGDFSFPYSKADPSPSATDPVLFLEIDREAGEEAFCFRLASGAEGWVHVEQVLEYNQDPRYMRDLILHKLTVEAERRVQESRLSKREIIRRLGTSATQFYRLLDPTNYRKSIDQVLSLLYVLDCEVDLVVNADMRTPRAQVARGQGSSRP